MPSGYLTTVEAAARTGLSSKTLIKRAKPLGALQRGRRWWIPAGAVDEIRRQLRRERDEAVLDAKSWVSLREAARIIGCDDNTVLTYVKRGEIERRSAPRNQPSISRRSVGSSSADGVQDVVSANPSLPRVSAKSPTHRGMCGRLPGGATRVSLTACGYCKEHSESTDIDLSCEGIRATVATG